MNEHKDVWQAGKIEFDAMPINAETLAPDDPDVLDNQITFSFAMLQLALQTYHRDLFKGAEVDVTAKIASVLREIAQQLKGRETLGDLGINQIESRAEVAAVLDTIEASIRPIVRCAIQTCLLTHAIREHRSRTVQVPKPKDSQQAAEIEAVYWHDSMTWFTAGVITYELHDEMRSALLY
mgnify:CR=1 FL=1